MVNPAQHISEVIVNFLLSENKVYLNLHQDLQFGRGNWCPTENEHKLSNYLDKSEHHSFESLYPNKVTAAYFGGGDRWNWAKVFNKGISPVAAAHSVCFCGCSFVICALNFIARWTKFHFRENLAGRATHLNFCQG